MAQTQVFKNNGDRANVPDILILMTDGEPTREIQQLPVRDNMVKNDNIRIIGIGVSKAVSLPNQHPYEGFSVAVSSVVCYGKAYTTQKWNISVNVTKTY